LGRLAVLSNIVETLGVDGSDYKEAIVRRIDGLLQVHLLRWVVEVVPDYGKVAEFWGPVQTAASITDDILIARSIGRELLWNHDPTFPASRDPG
jgi:hypothetical protein